MSTQTLDGYLRGVRGILITELTQDGAYPAGGGDSHWVDTAQQAELSAEIVTGETADLRGGDRLLLRLEEDDVIVGVNVTFTDARFNIEATEVIAGGTIILADATTADPPRTNVGDFIGWVAPTIEEQSDRSPFQADVYVQSFDEHGGREAFLVYSFTYCRGRMPEASHSDRGWGTPEFEIKARQNSGMALSTYQKLFIPANSLDTLPPDKVNLTSADVLFQSDMTVSSGATVTLAVPPQTGHDAWFAPAGTLVDALIAGTSMTTLVGDSTAAEILAPADTGAYKLFVVDTGGSDDVIVSTSTATLTVEV